jgi:Tol biopolymer transport system component
MDTPLIPRKVLFGNPDKASVQLSPNGSQIAYLAPRDGVLNVWVAPREDPNAARPVTNDTGRGVRFYTWAFTNTDILYIQDKNGDENWRIYRVDLESDETKDLTPFEGVQAQFYAFSPKHPGEIVIGINNRQPEWHDAYRLDIATGEMTLMQQNEGFMTYIVDDDHQLRFVSRMTPDGGLEMMKKTDGGWQSWETIPQEDADYRVRWVRQRQ